MVEPYLLEPSEGGLIFTTNAGVEYAVLFREQQIVLFPKLPQLLHHVFTFSFFPLSTPEEKTLADERIMPTIVKAIRDKFAEQLNVVLFVVEDGDRRHNARWRMFESLHAAARDTNIELISSTLMKGTQAVMSAVLVHIANPYRIEVEKQFYALLSRFSKGSD